MFTHILIASDWRVGEDADELVVAHAEAFVAYAYKWASAHELERVILLGEMVDPGGPVWHPEDTERLVANPNFARIFGPMGHLQQLAERFPTYYFPGVRDAFVTKPEGHELASAMDPIVTTRSGAAAQDGFVFHNGYDSAMWRIPGTWTRQPRGRWRWLSYLNFRLTLLTTKPTTMPAEVHAAIAAHRLRAPAIAESVRRNEARTKHEPMGIIHAATGPYFGQFEDEVWAGCPGGLGYCIRLDTGRPDTSELVHFRTVRP